MEASFGAAFGDACLDVDRLCRRCRDFDPAAAVRLDIYKELVEINTVTATGDTAKAAEAMAARLRAAGFADADVQVFQPAPRKGNLVARLRGTGARKPILLLAHIDVVPANREDWSVDPFKLIEKDGYFYGRGTGDDKYMAAAFVANLIRYKKEGYKPDRDIILALETDEEILDRDELGIQWLLKNHRDLIDAEFALNEGGGVGLKNGKPIRNSVQTTRKGLGELPAGSEEQRRPQLAAARRTTRSISWRKGWCGSRSSDFPLNLNETTRAYFERTAQLEIEQTAADIRAALSDKPDPAVAVVRRLSANPAYNAQLRTTCVATMLEGGHAVNALPQLATRHGQLPHHAGRTGRRRQGDAGAACSPTSRSRSRQIDRPVLSAPSALHEEIMGAIEKLSQRILADALRSFPS